MLKILRRASPADHGHHWHVIDTGWSCCACSARVARRNTPPVSETTTCAQPVVADDSLQSWLADDRPLPGAPATAPVRVSAVIGSRR